MEMKKGVVILCEIGKWEPEPGVGVVRGWELLVVVRGGVRGGKLLVLVVVVVLVVVLTVTSKKGILLSGN